MASYIQFLRHYRVLVQQVLLSHLVSVMSRLCHSLDELILNSCQLTNSGKTYHINIYKSNLKKNVKGVLTAHIKEGQFVCFGGKGRCNNIVAEPFYFTLNTTDIETITQMRMLLRQLLLSNDWKYIVDTNRRI